MRTKKAFYNVISSSVMQLTSIVCGLIAPRLILEAFGSTYNGVINSANQLLGFISILNLGIAGATRVALYDSLAQNDIEKTSGIILATKKYMCKVGLCLIVYTVVLSFIYPLISHNSLDYGDAVYIILIVGISSFSEYFFGLTNQILLTADQASYVFNIINISKTIINTILIAILIKLNSSIFIVKLGSSIVFFISPLILNFYVKKRYKLISNCKADDSAIKNRGAVAFHSIANIVHNNVDILVLTLILDAKVISVYTVYYLVVGKCKSLMTIFTTGIEGAFGNIWAKKEYDRLKTVFKIYECTIFSITSVLFSCVCILLLPFIRLYTKNIDDINYNRMGLAFLFTISETVYSIRNPYVTIVQAAGRYSETRNGAICEAFINLILSIVLVFFYGIIGVVFSTLVANLFRTVQYALYSSKHILNRPISFFLYEIIWFIIDFSLILLVHYTFFNRIINIENWKDWIIYATITFIYSAIITSLMATIFYRSEVFSLLKIILRTFNIDPTRFLKTP